MGRSVLVTGGNRGIGLAIAKAFAAQGDQVAVTHRSGADGLPGSCCRCSATSPTPRPSTPRSPRSRTSTGRCRCSSSNAGITDDTLLMRMSEDSFTRVVDANLTGAYRVAKRASRGMLKARSGRMIFVSSRRRAHRLGRARSTTPRPRPGLVGLARSIARELGSRGITANVVAPGFVDTDMTRALPDGAARRDPRPGPARPLRRARGDRRRRHVAGLGRRRVRHRRGDPGRRRPRHGPLEHPLTERDERTPMGLLEGKRLLDHRCDHRRLARVPRREGRPGAGRAGRAHRVRPDAAGRADRAAAAGAGAGGRARRAPTRSQLDSLVERRLPAPRGRAGPRRGAALDRLRAGVLPGRGRVPRRPRGRTWRRRSR